ncbi:hypothetical protein [Streptomyces sp. NPDC051173]|uniref:hypothetical protein n=1 Tax=Streptomyces sp. NPDC051173 TaxID=3155164 RepID=UPI00344E7430
METHGALVAHQLGDRGERDGGLIFGVSGFQGGAVARLLAEQGRAVRGFARRRVEADKAVDGATVVQDPAEFEAGLAQVVGAEAAAGVYRWAAAGDEPELFAADPRVTEQRLGIRLASPAEWISAQPWHIWSTAGCRRRMLADG